MDRSSHRRDPDPQSLEPTSSLQPHRPMHASSSSTLEKSVQRQATTQVSQPPQNQNLGSCWTCLIRHKKCDCQKGEDAKCRTCRRLKLQCFGWGPRRPPWMKDKLLVERIQKDITQQLLTQGMVRGISRSKVESKRQQEELKIVTKVLPHNPRPHPYQRDYQIKPPTPSPPPSVPPISNHLPSLAGGSGHSKPSLPTHQPNIIDSYPTPPHQHSQSSVHSREYVAPLQNVPPLRLPETRYTSSLIPPEPVQWIPTAQAYSAPMPDLPNSKSDLPLSTHPRFPSDAVNQTIIPDGQPPPMYHSTNLPDPGLRTVEWTQYPETSYSTYEYGYPQNETYGNNGYLDSSNSVFPSYNGSLLCATNGPDIYEVDESYQTSPLSTISTRGHYSDIPDNYSSHALLPTLSASPSTQISALSSSPASIPEYIYSPRFTSPIQPSQRSTNQQDLIFYYFTRIVGPQLAFDAKALDTMLHLVNGDPTGVVASSVTSLAALHDTRMRTWLGLAELSDIRTPGSYLFYYQRAERQLQLRRMNGVRLTEADAAAGLHLLSCWLMMEGPADWAGVVKVVHDWFETESGIPNSLSPVHALHHLRPETNFLTTVGMWMDIFISITLSKSPRFLHLYRRLLRDRLDGYGGTKNIFRNTNGSDDVTMLSLANIIDLEVWKFEHIRMGLLDIGELCRRGDVIEATLRYGSYQSSSIVEVIENDTASDGPSSNTAVVDQTTREKSIEIHRCGALVYLSSIVHGLSPSIPENRLAVNAAVAAFKDLAPSPTDRMLVFPIIVMGCMTDDREYQNMLVERLQAIRAPVNICEQVVDIMRLVWQRRETVGELIGWRDAMRELGLSLLLI